MGEEVCQHQGKGRYNNRLKQLISLYQNVEGYKGAEGMAKIHKEAVADLVGDFLFTDPKFLQRLLENRNLFQRLWDEIKYLATVTSGTEEARRLAELQRAFEKAYNGETKKPTQEGGVKYALAKIENITPSEEIMEQNIRDVADMKAVHTIDASKLIPGAKSIKDVYNDFFTEWGENIHSDKFGDIAAKSSSVRSDIRHGSTPVKIASIEAIPSVIKNGKIINWFEKNPGLFRITVAAPIKIGNEGYYMGVMLQRDNQSQRLYIHDVIIEEEASDHSQEHLSSTGPDESQKDLFLTNILQKIKEVKKYSVSKETAPSDNTVGWQIKGEDVLLQQEADANGLVWENGVPFRKDLLELARKRQSGEFSIAPPVPESVKMETAKSQAAASIAPPTPAENNEWKVQKQEQLRKKLKNDQKQYRGMEKMLSDEITALEAQLNQVKDKDSQKAAEIREKIKERQESKLRWKKLYEEESQKIKEEILHLEGEIETTAVPQNSIAPPTPAEQEIEDVVKEADGDEDEVESRLLQKKINLEWQIGFMVK